MTDVLIKRELLEDLRDAANDCLNHEIMRGNDRNVPAYTELVEQADMALAAPRQPESDLEVVAYMVGRYTTDQRESAETFALHHAGGVTELCRLSDAKCAIAELDRKVWEWSSAATAEAHRVDELKAERDTLRQQLADMTKRTKTAEREAGKALRTLKGLEKVAKVVSDNSDQVCGELNIMRQQRDKLAGLLREVRAMLTDSSAVRKRIDAALADLNT